MFYRKIVRNLFCFIVTLFPLFPLFVSGAGDTSGAGFTKLLEYAMKIEPVNRDSSVIIFQKVIQLAEKQNFVNDQIVNLWIKLSKHYYYRGNTELAIRYSLRVLSYANQHGIERLRIKMKILTGDILRGNNLFEQSYFYLNSALAEASKLKENLLVAESMNRLAAVYLEDGKFGLAEKYALVSLHLSNSLGNDSLAYNNYNILGVKESSDHSFAKSLYYLEKALPLAQKAMPEDVPLVLINLARNYQFLNRNRMAEQLSLEALKLAEKFQIPQYIRLSSLNLRHIYIQRRDLQKALRFDSMYYQSKESILTQKVQVQLQDFNSRLDTERQTVFAQKLILEKELTENKFFYLLFSAALLIFLLFVITGFLIQRHIQRNRIKQVVKQLNQSNVFLNRFISILAHDLRSPFNTILGYSDMLKNDPDLSEEDVIMAKEALCRVSNSAFQLLERLLEWSRLQTGSLKPEKHQSDLQEIIRDVIRLNEPAASLKNIKLEVVSPEPVIAAVDPDMIHTTIRNLISNAIKFSHRGGLVRTTLFRNDREIQINVIDSGVGISEENLGKVFKPDEHLSSYGTAGEKGTGLGLTLCREYVRLHQGVIWVTSTIGTGSTFCVTLPVGDTGN